MEKYIKAIKEYSRDTYKNMIRKPQGQLKHPFIVPGSKSYNNILWDWDSWLTNIAVRQIMNDNNDFDEEFIESEKGCIINFLEHTLENGRMPIALTPDNKPSLVNQRNIHKPCIAQHAAFIIKTYNGDAEWIRPYLKPLTAFVDYYIESCRHNETGLYFWLMDNAIGVDNDPCTFYRPQNSSASIYLNCFMYKELKAMCYILELLDIDATKYKDEAEHLKNAIQEHLWDERDGFYYSADLNLRPIDENEVLHRGAPRHWHCLIQRIDVWSGFLAMWAGIPTKEQADRVVLVMTDKKFWADYGVCTLSKLEKMYVIKKSGNPSCWLGPIWGISNYFCFKALVNYGFEKQAKELAEKTIKLLGEDIIKNGQMHEYYHPDTGEGVNNPGFQNWNLLVNNMIAWLDGKNMIEEF